MDCLKKCLTVLVLFLLSSTHFVQGQGYKSIFGDSSTSWKFYTSDYHFFGVTKQVLDSEIDTINNNTYRRLRLDNQFNSDVYLREDSLSSKVWSYDDERNEELLVMDLSLEKNDSFHLRNEGIEEIESGWYLVDTTFAENKRKHVLLKRENRYDTNHFQFIEGVGPQWGLFINSDLYNYLLCQHKDGERNYFDSFFNPSSRSSFRDTILESCPKTGSWVGLDNKETQLFEVNTWPNPAREHINFQIEDYGLLNKKVLHLKCYSSSGKAVLSKKISSSNFIIQRPGNTGIYFYNLLKDNGSLVKSGKIIFTK